MAIRATHELHDRRASRNRGVGIVLVAFIAIVFGLTVVKVRTIGATEGFDHVVRPALETRGLE
ncbi:MAG: hypothetical protein AAGM21_14415 [Pseudomonadota bacterium]